MPQPTLELADIFRQYGPAYRQAHALPLHQHRLMQAIESCRTAVLGGTVEWCDHCQYTHTRYRSCRDRHCPKCQGVAREKWLAQRRKELLPTEYFHVVFTLPEPIAAIAFYNKKAVYDILFRATAETLLTIARDPKRLGVELGFFAVLHSWGQNLHFHPHLHCVVPGGGFHGGRISPTMSPDEQDAAVLRIVKDRAEAKRRRALLESELQAAGKALHVISEALPLLGSPVVNIPVLLKLIDENAELLAPSKLAQMMKEYADLTTQIADLDASAKAAGIE